MRLVTYCVGLSSRGLLGLVWSDLVILLLCYSGIECLTYKFLVKMQQNRLENKKNRFGLQVCFASLDWYDMVPLMKHLYLGNKYICFWF